MPMPRKPRGWRRTRIRIYYRDGGRCWLCGESVALTDLAIDHVIPRSRGGSWDDSNLRTAHARCNGSKGARSVLPRARVRERWQ